MRSLATALTFPLLLPAAAAPAAEFVFGDQTLTVPDGFTVERVAGPPLVDRPIAADFDELGRLYVAESSGSNAKVAQQEKDRPHRILRLEDTDGDGVFDARTVFADRMMFPEGMLYHRGAVYCGAPPTIWKLVDHDGDGVAEERTAWFEGKTLTGCANDLHGPYAGPDGWIYWAKGAFAKQTHPRPGRRPISDSAAHIFRCRPDGSGIDSFMSGGMDNPVEVAWSAGGELFFTTTFFNHPRSGRRDAVVHGIYGAVYPKEHGVLRGLVRTGDYLPAMAHLGPAAPCGLARYASGVFGEEFRDNLFSCQFNLHKVGRHVLRPEGSTFHSADSDFLRSEHPDFHPTDVLEDADGSLLVLDTGGWYKICCPTSQLAKPEVLGAIYRVRKVGAVAPADPRGLTIPERERASSADLAGRLGDPRPAVAERAVEALARSGATALPALAEVLRLKGPATVAARTNAVWALSRSADPGALPLLRDALGDASAQVRQAALHALGVARDRGAVGAVARRLKDDSPHLRRAAATALGRMEDPAAVPALLAAAAAPPVDRPLEHALIFALVEIGDPAATRAGLSAESPHARRAALIALDQMGDPPGADVLLPLLSSDDPVLRDTARWIYAQSPGRGGELTGYFEARLKAPGDDGDAAALSQALAHFSGSAPVQGVMARALAGEGFPPGARLRVCQALAAGGADRLTDGLAGALRSALGDDDSDLVAAAVKALRALRIGENTRRGFIAALLGVAGDPRHADEVRLAAVAAAGPLKQAPGAMVFDLLLKTLEPGSPPLRRAEAAAVVGRSALSDVQRLRLVGAVAASGPLERPNLLDAYAPGGTEKTGMALLDALEVSAGRAGIRPDRLEAALRRYPPAVKERGRRLLEAFDLDAAEKAARLDAIEGGLPEGNIARGHVIFNSPQAACIACHAVGYGGGNLGPGLSRIGAVRGRRDLLEAIVYPGASLVRSYETVRVTARDGTEHLGVIRDRGPGGILLATGPGLEVRIPAADVAEVALAPLSLMPAGLDQQLSPQQLADLLAFLGSLK